MGKKVQKPQIESDTSDEEDQGNFEMKDAENPQKEVINKEQLMKDKINQIHADFKKRLKIGKKQNVNWHEHMSLVGDETVEMQKMDINDDIQREVQFYNNTLDNVKLAVKYLQSENIPIRRPDDYFADMFKSDKHMSKIKSRLVQQQVKVQNFEEKQLREQTKKLSKKIKARTEFKKHQEKRENLRAIDEWKSEIKNKGEKAKDLSDFILKNRNIKKTQPQPQQYSKHKKNSGGGKVARQGKTIQKGGQQQKTKQQQNKKRPGKTSRHHKGSSGKAGGKKKKGKRGHQ